MFGKKIIIFALFGIIVFAGSIIVMTMLGPLVKKPETTEEADSDNKSIPTIDAHGSSINKVIGKMYYDQIDKWYDYNTQSKEANMLLNVIKPKKLITEIDKLKEQYELKNEELKGKAEKLTNVKEELVSERKRIELLKKDLEKDLDMINDSKQYIIDVMSVMDEEETSNMKLLASIYEGMKSKQAASIIMKMNHKTAVKLLKLMDQRNAAKILQDVEPNTAVKLSEEIRSGSIN